MLLLCSLATVTLPGKEWDEDLYRQIEQRIESPRLRETVYPVARYGAAAGLSAARNQRAIQEAIDDCSARGGGRVVVAAGEHLLTGAITLRSGVNLVVEEGAHLEFAFEPELYPLVPTSWEGLHCYNLQPCIYAFEAEDIAITGRGIIDGGGTNDTWWAWCGNPKFGWHEGLPSQRLGGRDRLLRAGVEISRRVGLYETFPCGVLRLEHERPLDVVFTFIRNPFHGVDAAFPERFGSG